MNDRIRAAMALVLAHLLSSQTAFALSPTLSADEVMKKNEASRKLRNVTAESVLSNGTAEGAPQKLKRFTWRKKLSSDGVHYNTLTRFHYPPEIRGEGILFLEQENGQAEVMLYLPNFKKTRRVERQAQSGSFMGSEFSYADISTPHLEDYRYKLLKQSDPCGTPAGEKCFLIESKPKSDAVRERTGYSRQLLWIHSDSFMISRGEFYDLEGKLAKKYQAHETRLIDAKEGRWMSHQLRMENVKNGRFTTLEFSKVNVSQEIPDSKFTVQELSRP